MKELSPLSQRPMRTCSLCNKSSQVEGISLIYFGEWMIKKDITVHYYCLLLSTHLPQRGEDHSGILGFLLRDIRLEIEMAKKRKCMYCLEMCATIQCDTCKKYFHLTCGHTSKCLSQFVGKFKSYCHACIPVDRYQVELYARKPPKTTELCFICAQMMGNTLNLWIYAKCCGNGFTHSKCMKMYALSAGYYLTCIWCKNKSFREHVKYLGVFVPDREANWEKQRGAYGELYRRHNRCDMDVCKCPKGRDYSNVNKWQLILCKLCGAFGAHNPYCIPGFENSKEKLYEFKCDVCSVTEQTVLFKNVLASAEDLIDTSLYVSKDTKNENGMISLTQSSSGSLLSQETIVNGNQNTSTAINRSMLDNATETLCSAVYTLTQSPQISQQVVETDPPGLLKIKQNGNLCGDDSDIEDFFVKKLLDIFEVKT